MSVKIAKAEPPLFYEKMRKTPGCGQAKGRKAKPSGPSLARTVPCGIPSPPKVLKTNG